jgi:hypothetical protein
MSRKAAEGENCSLSGLNKLEYSAWSQGKAFIAMLQSVFAQLTCNSKH